MMILIAHRGLVEGPNKDIENHPDQILSALHLGYDCEIDVWYDNDDWYLGHDAPQYKINERFLLNHKNSFWIHCKNEEAFAKLNEYFPLLNYFWHDTDTYTFTCKGIPWIYPGKRLLSNGICVLPELHYNLDEEIMSFDCLGFCSDYVSTLQKHLT